MISSSLGISSLSGIVSIGIVPVVFAQQTMETNIFLSWPYEGEDEEDNIWFLVYVNGRLVQRLEGSVRETEIVSRSYDRQEIHVIPWRKDMAIAQDIYGSLYAMRGHLEWTRPADTTITGYKIYSASSSGGTYTLYTTHESVSLGSGIYSMTGDSTLTVQGNYSVPNEHTNTLFTVTVLDESSAEITNDANGDILIVSYENGVPFSAFGGVILTISDPTGTASGSASFVLGVQPYYDTGILSDGTTWFKIATIDAAGNESALSSAVAVTVSSPPEPLNPEDYTARLAYAAPLSTYQWYMWLEADNIPLSIQRVNVYSNYDPSSNTLLNDVFFDTPLEVIETGGLYTSGYVFFPMTGKALGTYKFVFRCEDASGRDDGNTVVETVNYPYVADLPQPHTITATPTAGGAVDLSWYTDTVMPVGTFWRIGGDISPSVDPTVSESQSGPYFLYTTSLTAGQVGPEGTYEIDIYGIDVGLESGPVGSVSVTTDATAPSGISGLTGTPF